MEALYCRNPKHENNINLNYCNYNHGCPFEEDIDYDRFTEFKLM